MDAEIDEIWSVRNLVAVSWPTVCELRTWSFYGVASIYSN
jgi:hypothetical protein